MIITAIIGLFTGLASMILSLLPDFTAPSSEGWGGWFGAAADKLSLLDRWINIDLLVSLLGTLMAVLTAYAVVKVVTWVASHIPAIGIGGND